MNPAAAEIDAKMIGRGRSAYGEPALYLAATGSALMILLMLAALLSVLFAAAVPSIRRFGGEFLVSTEWRPNPLPVLKLNSHGKPIRDARTGMKVVDHNEPPKFGALASISGTVQTSAIALVLAVPLSLGAALYLVRIARPLLVPPISFLIEFLAAIPSIAYGLWGMFVLGPWMGGPARWERIFGMIPVPAGIESRLGAVCRHVPGLQWVVERRIDGKLVHIPTTGRDVLTAGLILGIMVVPIITAIARDILRNVPLAQIEGTIALGATWWQSCYEMLKFSRSGLFGAVILGLARAAGETMAVLMVMGSTPTLTASPLNAGATMASTLAGEFPEAATNDLYRGALMELALILLLMSLAFNIVARYLVVGNAVRPSAGY
jgi:phosphate transport system permease protein